MAGLSATRANGMASSKSVAMSSRPVGWLAWIAVTAAAFLIVEGFLFRLGWYYKYVEPDSSTGTVELRMYWLRRFRPAGAREILVVGDSRVAEGFSARQATEIARDQKTYFWNMGMAGAPPRVWYYVLRDADPSRRRFQAIVVALDHYAEQDLYDSMPSRLVDLNFVIARLGLADAWDFASTMKTPEQQRAAMIGALLKGTVIRQDARAFLQDIHGRIAKSKDFREHGLDYLLGYPGVDRNLVGLIADWEARTLRYPPGITEVQRESIQASLMPALPPQTGELGRYRIEWLGRILSLYRGSPTRIIFIEMPRGPLPQPDRPEPTTFVNWVRTQPNVAVVDARTFRDLETPETFLDGMHLNRTGRSQFTERFTETILDLLSRH